MKPGNRSFERGIRTMVIKKVSKKGATTCKCKGSC